MSRRKKQCPLVLIEWEDSYRPEPAWVHLRDISTHGPSLCASVGWLLHDLDTVKILASNMGGTESASNAQACGVMRIPTSAVRKMTKLEER